MFITFSSIISLRFTFPNLTNRMPKHYFLMLVLVADRVDDRDKPLENSNLKETGQQCNDRDDRVMISIGSQMMRANAVF